MAEKEEGLPPDNSQSRSDGRHHWGRKVLIIVAVIIFFVVLALGLGLGLGLGLKKDHHVSNGPAQPSSTSTPSTSSGSGSSNNYTQDMPSWRRDTQEYALDMDTWDINAASTTRIYNFTLSVIQAAPDGVVRDVLAINGQFPGPLIRMNRGDRLLVNVTNAMPGAFAEFEISVDNHTLAVIEADGVVTEPYPVHRLEIAIAQRYSVILTANQTATNYWMRYEMVTFCFGEDNAVLDPNGLTVLSYTNSTASPDDSSVDWTDAYDVICEDLNATNLVPVVQISPPPADVFLSIAVSFQIGDYALDRAFINSTTWVAAVSPTINQAISGLQSGNSSFTSLATSAPNATTTAFGANQFVFSVPGVQTVDLLVTNFDDGAHPFHLHGHTFWILATSATGYFDYTTYDSLNNSAPAGNPNPMRRDTMSVDAYGWALIRFVSDNPGMWAFHCHISWHLQAGLMMQFMAQPEVMSGWQLPSDVADLCVDAGAGAGNSAGG